MDLKEYLEKKKIDYKDFSQSIGLKYVNGLYKYIDGSRIPDNKRMAAIMKVTKGKVSFSDFVK